MKKIILFSITLIISLTAISCKKEVKKFEPAQFSIEPSTVSIFWTAFKTIDTIAVKGEFKTLEITNIKKANTALEALDGTQFSIPVSSLFSNNDDRDNKLKQLFFGVMKNTVSLTGTLNLKNDSTGSINLSMNGVSNEIPITYVVSGQLVEFSGKLDINDFNGQTALESLAKACFDLHKGADGVSKTWSHVEVSAVVYLRKK